VLLSIPSAIVLYVIGKPAIHLLFQHGAFTAHSSELTSLALLGYAFGLPAVTADTLLVFCFYAIKDARTPLVTNIGALAVHFTLLAILTHTLSGSAAIISIPLATAVTGTIEAVLLSLLLFTRLRKMVRADKGMQRLQKRRLQARG
jgi:putative peptidoglycan lipid II flippase